MEADVVGMYSQTNGLGSETLKLTLMNIGLGLVVLWLALSVAVECLDELVRRHRDKGRKWH